MKKVELRKAANLSWVFRAGDAEYKCYLSVAHDSNGEYVVDYKVYPTGAIVMYEGARHVVSESRRFSKPGDAYAYCEYIFYLNQCPDDQKKSFIDNNWLIEEAGDTNAT